MVFFNVLVFLPIFSTNQRTPRKYSVVAIMNTLQKKWNTQNVKNVNKKYFKCIYDFCKLMICI